MNIQPEKGRLMWARVKGKTENDLMKLPFLKVFAFRPGIIKPTKGLKNVLKIYRYFMWLFPVMNVIKPGSYCTLKEIGIAMINSVDLNANRKVLEVKDIKQLASGSTS